MGFPARHDKFHHVDFTASDWSNSIRKRAFDAAAAAVGLTVTLPVLAVVAALIKTTSPGPVLFRQRRVGRHQQPFMIYKFRTMRDGADECGPTVTCDGDDRTTRVGRLLRRFKLDELPQLINVLRGEMSMVGPRPKLAAHERLYLRSRPGITGAATLVFAREEELLAIVPAEQVESYTIGVLNPMKARIDAEYTSSATFRSDFGLLLRTVLRLSKSQAAKLQAELRESVPAHRAGEAAPAKPLVFQARSAAKRRTRSYGGGERIVSLKPRSVERGVEETARS